jgi:hypothetical protein
MALHITRATIRTSTGSNDAAVVSLDGPSLQTGIYAFLMSDDLGNSGPLLAAGRTLGVEDGVVRFGPITVVSAYAEGRLVLREGHVIHDGGSSPDVDGSWFSIGTIVGLLGVLPSTTWLPFPYAFEGDDVRHDQRTGEPTEASHAV